MIFLTQALSAQSTAASTETVLAADADTISGDSAQSQTAFGEKDIDFSSWGSASASGGTELPAANASFGLGVYVRMLVVLAIIVAAIILLFRFLKRAAGMQGVQVDDDTFLRHISGVSVGANKSVQIVTLVDRAYLIGVSDSSVNLIAEIEDKELVNAMNLWSDKKNKTAKPRSFADVLDIFMPHGPRAEQAAPSSASSRTAGNTSYDENLFSSANSRDLLASLQRQARRLNEEADGSFDEGGTQ
ncbi:MAG: flagellar biosynthetic protein FliO [Treponema sp.]|nr:flagellar biosynthetic protein FliO [Treponema sp.]